MMQTLHEAEERISAMEAEVRELKIRGEERDKRLDKLETRVDRMIYVVWGALIGAIVISLVQALVEALTK